MGMCSLTSWSLAVIYFPSFVDFPCIKTMLGLSTSYLRFRIKGCPQFLKKIAEVRMGLCGSFCGAAGCNISLFCGLC